MLQDETSTDYYWDTEEEEIINSFIEDGTLENGDLQALYEDHLYEIMDKMIRILIYKHNFYETGINNKDLVRRCHSKIYGVLIDSREHSNKYYDPERNSSFHYFTRIIKNYLIDLQSSNQKETERKITNTDYELVSDPDKPDLDYLFTQVIEYLEHNYQSIFKHDEYEIVEAFIKAVRQNDELINGRKDLRPIVYTYIESLSEDEFNTKYYAIKTVINRIYRKLKNKYLDVGYISNNMKITVR